MGREALGPQGSVGAAPSLGPRGRAGGPGSAGRPRLQETGGQCGRGTSRASAGEGGRQPRPCGLAAGVSDLWVSRTAPRLAGGLPDRPAGGAVSSPPSGPHRASSLMPCRGAQGEPQPHGRRVLPRRWVLRPGIPGGPGGPSQGSEVVTCGAGGTCGQVRGLLSRCHRHVPALSHARLRSRWRPAGRSLPGWGRSAGAQGRPRGGEVGRAGVGRGVFAAWRMQTQPRTGGAHAHAFPCGCTGQRPPAPGPLPPHSCLPPGGHSLSPPPERVAQLASTLHLPSEQRRRGRSWAGGGFSVTQGPSARCSSGMCAARGTSGTRTRCPEGTGRSAGPRGPDGPWVASLRPSTRWALRPRGP